MSLGLLYLLLLKATVTSFSGMGGLPQIRQDLVSTYQVVSDEQLSRAVLLGRSTPGPLGIYVVSVGYVVRGWPGAAVGWLALISPAFVAVPLLLVLRRWIHLARMRSAVDAVVIAGGTLLVPAGLLLARDAAFQLRELLGG